MAWTAPMSATANSVWTSAQWNTHVRDNLLMTMPGKASSANQWFAADGVNSIVQRTISSNSVATGETTASLSYAALATAGPAVGPITTGANVLVMFGSRFSNTGLGNANYASVAVSGGTTVAASDNWCLRGNGRAATKVERSSMVHLFTGLTVGGSHTFTMQYKVSAGTGTFQSRHLIVMSF